MSDIERQAGSSAAFLEPSGGESLNPRRVLHVYGALNEATSPVWHRAILSESEKTFRSVERSDRIAGER